MLSVEDFLTFQRKRLEVDKKELVSHIRKFLNHYDAQNAAASQGLFKEAEKSSREADSNSSATSTPRHGSSMIKANQNIPGLHFKDDDLLGLPLGENEQKRKKLAEERRAEYNRFLIEKEKQLHQKKEAIKQRRNTSSETSTPRSIASMNYQEVLQRKKEEEKQYRNINQLDPMMDDAELLRLQNETDKLKSERDNLTMLISSLKRFADSEPTGASTSQAQLSQSVPSINASTSSVLQIPNPFPVPGSFPTALPPSSAPTAFPSLQSNGNNFQNMLSASNFNPSLTLPDRMMPNMEYQAPVHPLSLPSTSFQNAAFTGHALPQQPRPNQHLNNSDYIHELNEQVKQKQQQKAKQLEEEKRQQPSSDFFPWGNTAGGGGAPMRDPFGNIITSRKGKSIPVLPSVDAIHPLGMPVEKEVIPAPSSIVNSFAPYNREHEVQRNHERYKEDLRKQIEEKKRFLQEEKERQRLEEERLAQRIEEQRLRMQREYEEEQAKRMRKAEELRLKQERLMQLQEEQRKEEDRRKREAAEKRERERLEKLRELEEMKKNSTENQPRSKSPPVPTVRTQTLDREKTAKDSRQNVLSQLTQLRQQLQEEQQKMNAKLKEQKKKYKVMDRRAVQEDSDDDDENEVHRLRRNSVKSRDSSVDSRGYTQRTKQWNKENIKYRDYGEDSDVRVENLE